MDPIRPLRRAAARAVAPAGAPFAALVALALAGCGGGGTGDASASAMGAASNAGPVSVAGSASAPASGPSGGPSGGATASAATTMASTCGVPDFVATALARINERRAAGATCGGLGTFAPAAPVAWDERLAAAADGHSRDMVGANFFAHTGSMGSTLTSRVNATSYAWAGLAENLAAGTFGIAATIDGWMASPGHCVNLMGPTYAEIGLACVPGNANTAYRTYWTLTLGRPR